MKTLKTGSEEEGARSETKESTFEETPEGVPAVNANDSKMPLFDAKVPDYEHLNIEPLFTDAVDFETFTKSDFRAVKVLECEAVPKSKKLLKRVLRARAAGRKDLHRHHEPAAQKDDGHRFLRHADQRRPQGRRRGKAPSSDGGSGDSGRREAVLKKKIDRWQQP